MISSSHQGLDFAQQGITEYIKRIGRFATIKQHTIKRQKVMLKNKEQLWEQDYPHIVTKIPKQSRVFILHARGKHYTSETFAACLEASQLDYPNITFIIGPAYGLSRQLFKDYETLALSKMTLQHEIAELCLYEQIYRALTIINNHPYHQ